MLKYIDHSWEWKVNLSNGINSQSDSNTPPKVDLSFAVVDSTLVGEYNFRRQLWLVQKLIREFSVSPSGTRVAMVTYATTPKAIFGLNDNVNRECTAEAVTKAKWVLRARTVMVQHFTQALARRMQRVGVIV